MFWRKGNQKIISKFDKKEWNVEIPRRRKNKKLMKLKGKQISLP